MARQRATDRTRRTFLGTAAGAASLLHAQNASAKPPARDWAIPSGFEAELADWMDAQAKGTAEQAFCAFTEPNLQFERTSASAIRVRFSHESAPSWAEPHYGEIEYGIDIPVGPGLSMAAEQLRGQLARFPVRGRK